MTALLRKGRVAHRLVLADHVWSVRDYEALARALQKPLAPRKRADSRGAGAGALESCSIRAP